MHAVKIQISLHLLSNNATFTAIIVLDMFLKLYEKNPDQRQIDKIVNLLRNGGVIIYPTDTVYGMGCDITKARAVERVARIKGIKPEKARFSFICLDCRPLFKARFASSIIANKEQRLVPRSRSITRAPSVVEAHT